MKVILSFFILIFIAGAEATQPLSSMETINQKSDTIYKVLDLDFEAKVRSLADAKQTKIGFFTKFYRFVGSLVKSKRGDPQADLDELSQYYMAMNTADLTALNFLQIQCGAAGQLLDEEKDKKLCQEYPKFLLKQVEARIAVITSKVLFSNQILLAPPGWVNHSGRALKVLSLLNEDDQVEYNASIGILKSFDVGAGAVIPKANGSLDPKSVTKTVDPSELAATTSQISLQKPKEFTADSSLLPSTAMGPNPENTVNVIV